MVKKLLDMGASPNAVNEWGRAALKTAIFYGHADVARELWARGATG